MDHPDEGVRHVYLYPRFPVDPFQSFAFEPMDVGNLPPLVITIEESEDLKGWGPAKPPE